MEFKDKYEYYYYLKFLLEQNGFEASEFKEINFGLQFGVNMPDKKYIIRIFESKKNGIKYDLSQIKDQEALTIINRVFNMSSAKGMTASSGQKAIKAADREESPADIHENPLIGTDESGKGDYFGPLVIAGVYADGKAKDILRELGVDDSKKLSDVKIAQLADKIKILCKNSIIVIGNAKYNEMYAKIGNLNRLLAWGHARAIENILNETECSIALSDQFGNPALIKNALMGKGKQIQLEQRHRAEENVVVAAASILARNEYVKRLSALTVKYKIEFPKGASNMTKAIGKNFVELYGRDELKNVAKLHFKTTQEL